MAQHHDAAAIVLPPQHLGGGKARRAAADNHDPTGRIDDALDARPGLLALLPDENAIAFAARPSRPKSDSGPEPARLPRSADRNRRDARDSGCSRRPPGLRRAGHDNGCSGRRWRRFRTPKRTSNTSSSPTWPSRVVPENSDSVHTQRQIGTGGCGLLISHILPPWSCLRCLARSGREIYPVSAAFTSPLALPKSICPAYFAFSAAITLPMSFMPAAWVSAITAAIAALTSSSDICFGK